MKIECPNCGFSKEIDESKLPPNARKASCPKCRQKFDLYPETAPDDFSMEAAEPAAAEPGRTEERLRESMAETIEETAAEIIPPETGAVPPPLPPRQPLPDRGFGAARPSPEGIPWEQGTGGFFGNLLATIRLVLFSPAAFFDRMPPHGGYKAPLGFGVIVGTIGFAFSAVWQMLFMILGAGFSPDLEAAMPMMASTSIMVGVVVMSPILVLISMFVSTFFVHLFLMIVRGAQNGFEATFRVVAYTMATNIFGIVPLIGSVITFGWMLVLMIVGLPRAHQTGVGRVIVALFIIPLLLIVLIAVLTGVLAMYLMNQ